MMVTKNFGSNPLGFRDPRIREFVRTEDREYQTGRLARGGWVNVKWDGAIGKQI